MREIKTHRLGDKLNEVIRLEYDEDSCRYTIAVKSHNTWGDKHKIEFQIGDFTEKGPAGVSEEVLLAIVLDRIQHRVPSSGSMMQEAWIRLRESMFWLNEARKGT